MAHRFKKPKPLKKPVVVEAKAGPRAAGPPPEILQEARRRFAEQERGERERVEQFGQIRPVIALENRGHRFVAVRNRMYWGNWRFFPDFLRHFGYVIFGKEWHDAERAKPADQQHPLLGWQIKAGEFMERQTPAPDGVYSAIPNGPLAACLSFYYDLYVVDDNNRLDDILLARLKHRQQFQGARHELFAEATCLRAGFAVDHEDERDGSQSHVEFVATHKATGQKISIEAKSKHRPGILGRGGEVEPPERASLRFVSLINDAAAKQTQHPLAIFFRYEPPSRPRNAILRAAVRSAVPPFPTDVEGS